MDFELGPELEALRNRARRFAEERLYPLELRVEEHGPLAPEVSRGLFQQAIAEGLWPMNVPREMGGLGSTVMEQVIAQEEAGRATNDLWGYVGGPYNALLAGTPEQRRKYLEPALRGEVAVAAATAARNSEFQRFVTAIKVKIQGKANVPDNVSGRPAIQVRIRILPGGDVLEATVVRSSGNRAYDAAIERAILSAQPLPVPPADSELFPQFRDLILNIEHDR